MERAGQTVRGNVGSKGSQDEKRKQAGSDAAPLAALSSMPGDYSAEELAELERRDRMSGWLLLFFAGAALATAILAFYLFFEDVDQNDEFVRIDREEPVEVDDTPFNWGLETPEPEQDSIEGTTGGERAVAGAKEPLQPDTPPADSGEQVFNFPGPPESPPQPTFPGPPAGSVDRETSRALRSGRAQQWREDGERGYVLVSKAVQYGTRECRQVSYTRFEEGRQAISPSRQWCRLARSTKWRPDPRGPE